VAEVGECTRDGLMVVLEGYFAVMGVEVRVVTE